MLDFTDDLNEALLSQIREFRIVTNCDEAAALFYLRAMGGSLPTALDYFFQSNGAAHMIAQVHSQQPQDEHVAQHGNRKNVASAETSAPEVAPTPPNVATPDPSTVIPQATTKFNRGAEFVETEVVAPATVTDVTTIPPPCPMQEERATEPIPQETHNVNRVVESSLERTDVHPPKTTLSMDQLKASLKRLIDEKMTYIRDKQQRHLGTPRPAAYLLNSCLLRELVDTLETPSWGTAQDFLAIFPPEHVRLHGKRFLQMYRIFRAESVGDVAATLGSQECRLLADTVEKETPSLYDTTDEENETNSVAPLPARRGNYAAKKPVAQKISQRRMNENSQVSSSDTSSCSDCDAPQRLRRRIESIDAAPSSAKGLAAVAASESGCDGNGGSFEHFFANPDESEAEADVTGEQQHFTTCAAGAGIPAPGVVRSPEGQTIIPKRQRAADKERELSEADLDNLLEEELQYFPYVKHAQKCGTFNDVPGGALPGEVRCSAAVPVVSFPMAFRCIPQAERTKLMALPAAQMPDMLLTLLLLHCTCCEGSTLLKYVYPSTEFIKLIIHSGIIAHEQYYKACYHARTAALIIPFASIRAWRLKEFAQSHICDCDVDDHRKLAEILATRHFFSRSIGKVPSTEIQRKPPHRSQKVPKSQIKRHLDVELTPTPDRQSFTVELLVATILPKSVPTPLVHVFKTIALQNVVEFIAERSRDPAARQKVRSYPLTPSEDLLPLFMETSIDADKFDDRGNRREVGGSDRYAKLLG
ncbi:Hypothetical protein, putative, partial [Bodo saltans]